MRLATLGVLLFVFWSGFYTLLRILKDERMIAGAFVITLVISMVTAAVMMAKQKCRPTK